MGIERRATDSAPTRYRPRRPSESVLYRCVQEHLETWLAQCRDGHDDDRSAPEYVELEFRRYLDCGILAHGFARPPFALDRLRELNPERLRYELTKPGPGGAGSLLLTPVELIDRIAALVPPPRVHRHRYFGVLAPNAPLRPAVTALALAATTSPPAANAESAAEPAHRRAARYAWALLLARIYEVFPLVCPHCGSAMRIIAFITDPAPVRDILVRLGEPTAPPRIAPARGPPLWDLPEAGTGDGDPHAQPAPEYAFDQRIAW